jgi:hypothetical protein
MGKRGRREKNEVDYLVLLPTNHWIISSFYFIGFYSYYFFLVFDFGILYLYYGTPFVFFKDGFISREYKRG